MADGEYEKIILSESVFGHRAHADWFQPDSTEARSRLAVVVFIGGAVTDEVYHSREVTSPSNIFDAFKKATLRHRGVLAGLLVIPAPYGWPDSSVSRPKLFSEFAIRELFPKGRIDPGQVIAIVGYSMGAYLGLGLHRDLPRLAVNITIAGVGMVRAAHELAPVVWPRRIICYSNIEDVSRDHTIELSRFLRSQQLTVEQVDRFGTHSFDSYEKNGTLLDAFSQAIDCLLEPI